MKVKEVVKIELTVADIRKIIKKHFSKKYDVEHIYFDITTEEDLGMPPYYVLGGAKIDAVNKKEENTQEVENDEVYIDYK